jgi:hypothetical protein
MMDTQAICPECGLPMSYLDIADEDRSVWYCDGPNDSTDRRGCFAEIDAEA